LTELIKLGTEELSGHTTLKKWNFFRYICYEFHIKRKKIHCSPKTEAEGPTYSVGRWSRPKDPNLHVDKEKM
jgi:hypothetical protein